MTASGGVAAGGDFSADLLLDAIRSVKSREQVDSLSLPRPIREFERAQCAA